MNARWDQVERILDVLLEAPPEEHGDLLEQYCSGNAVLRREVESLMAAHRSAGTFLETSAGEFSAPFVADIQPNHSRRIGQVVGRYRLTKEIGRGGMGTVYLAERADGHFEQRVALKVIKPGMDSDEILRRFLRERQILARLQHPNIARLLDGGLTDDDYPYFVMEYVTGEPITTYCSSRGLSVEDRLRLFEQACRVVQFAHRNLVVHRDLKPSNVLVTEDGTVKLLDFGIAGMLNDEDDDRTETGQRLMTPSFASPEQVRGETVTTASDVYQLGLILYGLLTDGRRPYHIESRSPTEIERVVCTTLPVRPSKAAAENAALSRRLRGDVDAIVLTALHKEPERRHAGAEALAEDVRRHLAGQPVAARGDGAVYRTATFLRRHRVGAAATALVVLVSLGFGLLYTVRMKAERDRARVEAIKAVQSAELVQQFFENWDPDAADRGKVRARDLLRVATARTVREWQHQPEVQATLLSILGSLYTNAGDYRQADSLLALAYRIQETLSVDGDLAATVRRQAQLLYQRGEYDAAEHTYRRALDLYRGSFGSRNPEPLRTQQGLATVLLHGQERFPEAESLYREILTLHDAGRIDTSLIYADATRGLGLTLFFQGRNEEAAGILGPALEEHRRLYGNLHPVTLLTMQAMSANLRDLGRVNEAVDVQREVLRIHRQLYGDEHAATVFARFVLAFNLHRQGKLSAALELMREVMAQTVEAEGNVHPVTGRYVRFFAYVLLDLGDEAEAERALRRALAIYRQAYSYRHDDEAGILNRLVYVLLRRGAADADAVYREALAVHRTRGDAPVFITYGLHYLAWAMQRNGDAAEAGHLYRDALAMYERLLPRNHAYLEDTRRGLAALDPAADS